MNIAILDGVVVAVVLVSAILAMFRGFVREVLSIAAWVAAAILAYLFYEELVPYVSQYIDNPTIAIGVSAAAIFLVSLIIVSLITMKISDFVMDSPVGPIDRLLGFIFGAARGILLAVVAVIFFNWLVDAQNRPAWVTTAATYPELSRLGDRLLSAIPDDPESAIRDAFEGAGEAMQDTGEAVENAAEPAGTSTVTPQNREGLDQLIDGAADNSTVIAPTPAEPATAPTVGGQN